MSTNQTVRAYPAPEPTPNFRIAITPLGTPYTYIVGEEAYSPANTYYTWLEVVNKFAALVTFAGPGQVATGYEWKFGDGTTGATNPVEHAYMLPGETSLTLVVTDNRGVEHRAYKTVYLAPSITGEPIKGKVLTNLMNYPLPFTTTYQWQTSTAKTGASWTNISGATSTTYTLLEAQVGLFVRCISSSVEGTTPGTVIGPIKAS